MYRLLGPRSPTRSSSFRQQNGFMFMARVTARVYIRKFNINCEVFCRYNITNECIPLYVDDYNKVWYVTVRRGNFDC